MAPLRPASLVRSPIGRALGQPMRNFGGSRLTGSTIAAMIA